MIVAANSMSLFCYLSTTVSGDLKRAQLRMGGRASASQNGRGDINPKGKVNKARYGPYTLHCNEVHNIQKGRSRSSLSVKMRFVCVNVICCHPDLHVLAIRNSSL
jgi:hypothetical protein